MPCPAGPKIEPGIMAILEHSTTHTQYILSSSHLVGRSHVCALRCENPRVSAEHAVLRWNGAHWEVRDLGSSNGTFVNRIRLDRGHSIRVEAGARIAFGDATDIFYLIDDSPPTMCARPRDGSLVMAEDRVLALPSADAWAFLITPGMEPGRWLMKSASGESRAVSNQDMVHHGEQSWCLDLPIVIGPTERAAGADLRLEDIRLLFEIRDDEERVIDITIVHAGGHDRLPHRPNADLLLLLARERLDDARYGTLQECEQGWLERDLLLEELSESRGSDMTHERLTVEIYRARNQLRAAGIVDAERVIERRRSSVSVRLGTDKVDIVSPRERRERRRP